MENEIKQSFIKWGAVIVIVFVILYKIQRFFEKRSEDEVRSGTSNVDIKEAGNKIVKDAKKKKQTKADIQPSYPKDLYFDYARTLEDSLHDLGGFSTTKGIFERMNNLTDMTFLDIAFGKKQYYLFGIYAGDYHTLRQWLINYLSKSDIKVLNDILQAKKINWVI